VAHLKVTASLSSAGIGKRIFVDFFVICWPTSFQDVVKLLWGHAKIRQKVFWSLTTQFMDQGVILPYLIGRIVKNCTIQISIHDVAAC